MARRERTSSDTFVMREVQLLARNDNTRGFRKGKKDGTMLVPVLVRGLEKKRDFLMLKSVVVRGNRRLRRSGSPEWKRTAGNINISRGVHAVATSVRYPISWVITAKRMFELEMLDPALAAPWPKLSNVRQDCTR